MSVVTGRFKLYELAKFRLDDGTFDLDDTANWKLAFLLSTSNANNLAVGTAVYGDLTNEHATANGYTIGGVTLTGVTLTRTGGTIKFTASNLAPAWSASGAGMTGRYLVIYKNATVNGIVKPLLAVCLCDLTSGGTDVSVAAGQAFDVTFNASGIVTHSGADID